MKKRWQKENTESMFISTGCIEDFKSSFRYIFKLSPRKFSLTVCNVKHLALYNTYNLY